MNIWFGKKAKDKVTGFVGTITGKIEWMYGCNQYCIVPSVDKDGKLGDGNWFDEGRIEIIEDSIDPESVKAEKNGADWHNMPRAH
jgi:hypothetical protein